MVPTFSRLYADRLGRPRQLGLSGAARQELGLTVGSRVTATLSPDDVLTVTPDPAGALTVRGSEAQRRHTLGVQGLIAQTHDRLPLTNDPLRAEVESGQLRVWLREPLPLGEYRRRRFARQWRGSAPLQQGEVGEGIERGTKGLYVSLSAAEREQFQALADAEAVTLPMLVRTLAQEGYSHRRERTRARPGGRAGQVLDLLEAGPWRWTVAELARQLSTGVRNVQRDLRQIEAAGWVLQCQGRTLRVTDDLEHAAWPEYRGIPEPQAELPRRLRAEAAQMRRAVQGQAEVLLAALPPSLRPTFQRLVEYEAEVARREGFLEAGRRKWAQAEAQQAGPRPPRQELTRQVREQVAALYAEGHSHREIGQLIGIDASSVTRHVAALIEAGALEKRPRKVAIQKKGLSLPPGEIQKTVALWQAGQSLGDMAAGLGLSRPAVDKRIRRLKDAGLIQERTPQSGSRPRLKRAP